VPLRRILLLVFAGAAALSVLTALPGLDGGVPHAAGVIALLTAAAYVVLEVGRPMARWALSAGIVVLAAVPVAGWAVADDDVSPAGRTWPACSRRRR
jgi:heme A synthase